MSTVRVRRPPPVFRLVSVVRVEDRSPRLRRITLGGPDLVGYEPGLPAASVRLLVPPAGESPVVLPVWTGNEYRYADGTRPAIRTLTPLTFRPEGPELDVEIVRHGDGPLSGWADAATPGAPAALSGPGRGYEIDANATSYLLAGDESAIPAIGQLLPGLPSAARVQVVVEATDVVDLSAPSAASVQWCVTEPGAPPGQALAAAVLALDLEPDVRIWVAGEAAAMQRIRRYMFEERGIPRRQAVIRGYWKFGRAGEDGDAEAE